MDVHIGEMIKAFGALGHEVILVSPDIGEDNFGSAGGWVSNLRARLPRFVSELLEYGYNYYAYRHLVRVIKKHRPDAIYERYALFLTAGIWAKRRFRLPLALEINSPLYDERREHGGLTLRWLARRCEVKAWRRADLCLPVTQVLAGTVRNAGVAERNIAVMPNGVDPVMFVPTMHGRAVREHYGLDGKIILGFSGFVRPWHGLDRVVQVMAEIAGQADVHLLVVGDGPARSGLEALARRLGIEDRVTFTGVVQRIDIAAYVSAFDIALQPDATAYASPLKLIEYMALGKAILALDQPNIRELLENERSAILFDRDSPESMRTALLRLIRDRALRERLGAAAAEEVKRRPLTWTANADHVASLLKRFRDAA